MKRISVAVFIIFAFLFQIVSAQSLKSPQETFGFQMGADKKLINWSQIVNYFQMLNEQSNRIKVIEIGRTTLKKPMIMAVIGSKESIQNLDKYQQIQQQIARPYDLDQIRAEKLIRDGKLVFLITLNIHSTEIASSQESVELAYELVTSNKPNIQKIRENVIVLLVPSLNPDGQDMVTKWYQQNLNTEYEDSSLPWKYHHYAGHDNNRDWFFFNLVESQNVAKVLYHDWYPEIVMDQHQMGSAGARLFLPPYADPVNPNVPASLMANVNMLGKHVVADMHDAGFTGVVTGTIFNAFFEGTMSKTPLWHNRIGILTEAASSRIASPIFFPKTSLRGMGIDLPDYAQQTNFLAPWPGGWWRLRDIIEYEKAATYSMLDLAATYKEKFKRNFYRLNVEAIQAGKAGNPFAFLIPLEQHDPNNAVEMLRRLRIANVEVFQAQADFTAQNQTFTKGTFIVPLAQPARAYIKDLLEVQAYPNLREYPGGPPRRPYDVTAWTLPLQFGVSVVEVNQPFTVAMKKVEPELPISTQNIQPGWIAFERRFNHSYKLVNDLLQSDFEVYELETAGDNLGPGSFVVQVSESKLSELADKSQKYQVPIAFHSSTNDHPKKSVKPARIAVYQPWISRSYDEGWLRLVLDNFGFEYSILHNADFKKKAKLSEHYDVLIFGSQSSNSIVDGRSRTDSAPQFGAPKTRTEYIGGIGKVGVDAVRQFLKDGGTLLLLGDACNFAADKLKLPVQNTLKNVNRKDYFAPGSLFEVNLDRTSSLTAGMQEKASIYANTPLALKLNAYHREIKETGFYGSRNILQSGWLVGEDKLFNKVALAEIPAGKGRAILYGFRVQHRGQTYGTFKLLFNALYTH
ncbi:MAG: M14 family metallopeptidase [bacterium]